MTEFNISTSNTLAVPRLVEDIVFVRRINGEQTIAFSIRWFTNEATCDFIEAARTSGSNVQAGTGIWDIIGRIPLMQNDMRTMNYLQLHVGQTFEVHVLLAGGEVISSALIDQSGKLVTSIASTDHSYISTRFRNINALREEFGVSFKLTDIPGSLPRNIVLEITGSTATKVNWVVANSAEFYARFPNMNSTGSFGTDDSTSGSSGGS
jgi:hypothetical protein